MPSPESVPGFVREYGGARGGSETLPFRSALRRTDGQEFRGDRYPIAKDSESARVGCADGMVA